MNKSRIEWCDHTWNPITGCRHGCQYCYARTMVKRFSGDVRRNIMATADYETVEAADGSGDIYILEKPMKNDTGHTLTYPFGFEPTYHKYRMDTLDKLKMGNNIFVGAMSDIFGKWVPNEWITDILGECKDRPWHNFLFLTKNPERYSQVNIPLPESSNMWYGTTITCQNDAWRFNYLPAFYNTFVSIEPLHEDMADENDVLFRQVDWIIIGAESGMRKNRVVPKREWIEKIVRYADSEGVPVFMKDSLIPIVGEQNMRRDFPPPLDLKSLSIKMKNRLYGRCAVCGKEFMKREMVTILARSLRGELPKQFGFMCHTCFKDFCRKHCLDLPPLAGLEQSEGE